MIRTAIKGVFAHKLRLTLTALAIVLGVAFVSGTYVFTDTIGARFDALFADVYSGVDVTVRPEVSEFGGESGELPAELADAVTSIDGVESVAPGVGGYAQLIDRQGQPIGGQGPPTLGVSWTEVPVLNTLRITEGNGRAPAAAGEVVIDAATAEAQNFAPGDRVDIAFLGGTETFRIVGIANFGTEDNLAGATLAAFQLEEAQRVLGYEGAFTQIDIAATEGVAAADLRDRVSPVLPSGIEAVTGDQQTQEQLDQVTEGLGFINTALLAFAGVAIFVGAFIIQNTFRITVAQRTKELAMLRAIGATRRQVVRLVVAEALIVATLGSAIGVGLGILLSEGLRAGMNAIGFGLPDGPLTVEPRTVIISMAVGISVTLVAALLPARKAASVPPVAAMRDGGETPPGTMRRRAVTGTVITSGGGVLLALGLNGAGIATVGAGALTLFLGVSVLAPLFARPLAGVLGWPLPRLFGVTGRIAQDNTRRKPRRTAATAAALMIGVSLVAFVSVFAASTKASVDETLGGTFPADFSFRSANLQVGVSPEFLSNVEALDAVAVVTGVRVTPARVDGLDTSVAGVDPSTIESVWAMDAATDPRNLSNGVFVSNDELESRGLDVGDTAAIEFPLTGLRSLEITGSFGDTTFGDYLVADTTFDANSSIDEPQMAFAVLSGDTTIDDARDAIDSAAAEFPTVLAQTRSEVLADAETQIDQMLALFQGLLGLAVVIAVMGITNTLALSIVERTREIGLLRAVGMIRRQVRQTVRWESVLVALFGALLGVGLGTVLGWSVVSALGADGLGSFVVPVGDLALYVVLAGVAGVLAAVLPARTAGRLNVLEAIAYE